MVDDGGASAIRNALLMLRPQNVAFRPDRVVAASSASSPAPDWTIDDIRVVNFVGESVITTSYRDRRKAARKIRQQRRRLHAINAFFGCPPDEGVPEALLRAKVVLKAR